MLRRSVEKIFCVALGVFCIVAAAMKAARFGEIAGSLELYAVTVKNGMPEGARRYLCSIGPEEALFGTDTDGARLTVSNTRWKASLRSSTKSINNPCGGVPGPKLM